MSSQSNAKMPQLETWVSNLPIVSLSASPMSVTTLLSRHHSTQKRHMERQILLLPVSIAVSWIVIVSHETEAIWRNLILLVMVAVLALVMISWLCRRLADPSVQNLGYVFLAKLPLLLILLYVGWVPLLSSSAAAFGYDPQRYYFQANQLAQSGFSLNALPSLNYTGILFFYGGVFAIFGHSPAAPALVNSFVTLLATLALVRIGYSVKRRRDPYDWTLGLAMVIPEVLWFDVMTARETVAMSLIAISVFAVAGCCIRKDTATAGLPLLEAGVAIAAYLLLGLIRMPMVLPVGIAVALLVTKSPVDRRRRHFGYVLLVLALLVLVFAPVLSMSLGGYRFDYLDVLRLTAIRNQAFLSGVSWNYHSLGRLLIPGNVVEAGLFAPIRALAYLVAPLPAIQFSLAGLAAGNWSDWQYLMTSASALVYVVLFPLAVASAIEALRYRRWTSDLVLHMPFWLTFLAIAGGNVIIEERYRLMAVPLFWGCIWLGRGCKKRLIVQLYCAWAAMLLLGALSFVAYKSFS